MTAQDVAEYFIFRATQDEDPITNLKLQKLLYYAQGFSLALFDRPLFSDPIEKWTHGPVVPTIYHAYKENGAESIPPIEDMSLDTFDEDTLELLNEVYSVYGQFSGFALRNMTHEEPPWRETATGAVIDLGRMKEYFKTRVEQE